MHALHKAGFDVEWFVVLIVGGILQVGGGCQTLTMPCAAALQGDAISAADEKLYRSLAHKTLGEFIAVRPTGFDESGEDEQRFLRELSPELVKNAAADAAARKRRQVRYEEEVRAGIVVDLDFKFEGKK